MGACGYCGRGCELVHMAGVGWALGVAVGSGAVLVCGGVLVTEFACPRSWTVGGVSALGWGWFVCF